MPDDVGVLDVHEDGHRCAASLTLDDTDHGTSKGSTFMEYVHVEPECALVVHDAKEHRMGGARRVVGKGLGAGHNGLGQQLAAIDNTTGSSIADASELTVPRRLDIEDLEHPGHG
jgi:hypothetical protein